MMKQATIHKHVLIVVILAVLAIAGCKSGSTWKMENPFSRKPKAPSKETPKEIDGIQLSAPPEKYSKELSKNESGKTKPTDKSSGKTFAQKGKYETFPSSKELKVDRTPEVAVTPGTNDSSATASIPSYKNPSVNGTKVASTATGNTVDKSSVWPATQPASIPGAPFPQVNQEMKSPASVPSPYPGTQQTYPGTAPAAGTYPGAQQTYPGTTPAAGTYPGAQQTYPGTAPAAGTYPGAQQTYPGTVPASTLPASGTTSSTSSGTLAPGFAPGSIGGN